MYYNIAKPGKPPKYICLRGSSKLEGYHRHMNALFTGPNNSCEFVGAVCNERNSRHNARAGTKNGGDPDYGMFGFP